MCDAVLSAPCSSSGVANGPADLAVNKGKHSNELGSVPRNGMGLGVGGGLADKYSLKLRHFCSVLTLSRQGSFSVRSSFHSPSFILICMRGATCTERLRESNRNQKMVPPGVPLSSAPSHCLPIFPRYS